MKRIILLFGALFAVLMVQAQDRGVFTCKSPEACAVAVGELLSNAECVYLLKESFPYDNKYVLEYKGAKPGFADSVNMRVVFIKRAKGANPAMEIVGEAAVYELQTMYGKFLDIFPVWKKYADPTADISAIATKGRCDRKKFENTDGSGEEYNFKEDSQDKSKWLLQRNSWYTTNRL